MLSIALDLLTGRYGASEYNDRSRAEWPSHPARLFSALVAAWADAEQPDPAERAALRWLEGQGAPELACSGVGELARRRVVTVYVPGNDPSALRSSVDARDTARVAAAQAGQQADRSGDRKALEVLPEHRNRQARTFPTVTPAQPTVWFVWPTADPDERTRATLDGLLARVARLGHSATLVSCRLADECERAVTLVPRSDGGTVLRVPGVGLLDRLERDHARHQGTRERLLPAAMTAYGPPDAPPEPEQSGVHSGDWIVLDLPSEVDGERQRAVALTRSLELARAVRDALVEHQPPGADGVISGRFGDGRPRPHLAVVPLPDVGHRWADGMVRGVALVLPRGERSEHLATALENWRATGLAVRPANRDRPVRFGPGRVVPADEGWSESPMALRRRTWCHPARQWVSVTPVALDRFVRALHHPTQHEVSDQRVREIVSRSCVHTGLPEPVEVVISPVGMTAAVPRAAGGSSRSRAFPRFVAAGSGEVKQTVHVALTFAEQVRGPVLLGAGRYLGYGLFLPTREPGGAL
ncbi:MAG: type I-G CRISPR-associated protein Csb2 [Pseudonocardiaceae bacterium]